LIVKTISHQDSWLACGHGCNSWSKTAGKSSGKDFRLYIHYRMFYRSGCKDSIEQGLSSNGSWQVLRENL
jgi:hypothetical protein